MTSHNNGPAKPDLRDQLGGEWLITTESGRHHHLDLDLMVTWRIPAKPDEDDLDGPLRRDGEPVVIVKVLDCTVGRPATFLIDLMMPGVLPARRRTTSVISIDRLDRN